MTTEKTSCDCDDPCCTVPGETCEDLGHEPRLACRVQRALAGVSDGR